MLKKFSFLLVLIFALNTTVYANEIIPKEVIRNNLENGVKEIIKVYELEKIEDLQVDINNFTEGETEYSYVGTEREEIVETDEKEVSHIVEIETMNKDRDYLLTWYDLTTEHMTEDGYYGILDLDEETLKTGIKGYVTKHYQVYENRTYPNLPSNDVAYIPKTINVGGYNYTMSNINWTYNSNFANNSIIPDTYTANVTYERTATSQNATGYITTVEYKGVVTKNTKETIQYLVKFQSEEIVEEVLESEEIETKEEVSTSSNSIVGLLFLMLFLCLIIGILIFVYFKFLHIKVKEMLLEMKRKRDIKKNMLNDIDVELDEEENKNDYIN